MSDIIEKDARLSDYDLSVTNPDLMAELSSANRQENNRQQLALEMSGYTGFLNSMLTPEQRRKLKGEETEAERMRRVAFEELQRQTSDMLADMREASAKAIKEASERVQRTQQVLDDMRARADRTDDGRIVFRTQDKTKGFFENGAEMTPEQFNKQQWTPNSPTWEKFNADSAAHVTAVKDLEDAKAYGARADYYSQRAAQGDLSADELKNIQTDLKAAPQVVKDQLPAEAFPKAMNTAGLAGDFNLSAAELAEIHAMTAPLPQKTGPGMAPK